MLLTSIMHLFIKLKKFNRDSMSVSSADWNIHYIPRTSPFVTSFFGYLHEKIQLLCHDIVDELQEAKTNTIEGILKVKLIQVFQTWRRRLEKCIQQEGDYFE
jgi:hypothetical protein